MRYREPSICLCCGWLAILSAGCDTSDPSVATDEQPVAQTVSVNDAIDFADSSPAELRSSIDDALLQSGQLAKMLSSGVNYQLRMKEFIRHINNGTAAADALAVHADAAPAEREAAAAEKFQLLHTGLQTAPLEFEERFQQEVAAALESNPQAESTIYAEALLLDHTIISAAKEDTGESEARLAALVDFARRRPDNAASVALLLKYGDRLERDGDIAAALECYRTAASMFPNSPHLSAVRQRLANIEAAARKQQAAEAAHRARIAHIQRKLGARNGYFVVYTHETGNKMLYRFEYDVFHGSEEAMAHILRLPKNWDWELTARFPETQDGYHRAMELRNTRIKKETAMTVPVFN